MARPIDEFEVRVRENASGDCGWAGFPEETIISTLDPATNVDDCNFNIAVDDGGSDAALQIVNRNEFQSRSQLLVSAATPTLDEAALTALPVNVETEIFRQPVPPLVNSSTCRDMHYTLFYRSGTPRMQLGPDNWYVASWTGSGNGSAQVHFSTRGESHTPGQFIGGFPVSQFGTGTLTPGQVQPLPDAVLTLLPVLQSPSPFNIWPGIGLFQVTVHWTLD